jgi:hypothetical protein
LTPAIVSVTATVTRVAAETGTGALAENTPAANNDKAPVTTLGVFQTDCIGFPPNDRGPMKHIYSESGDSRDSLAAFREPIKLVLGKIIVAGFSPPSHALKSRDVHG